MADIKPNLEIRKKQLNIRLSEFRLNIERMVLRKMEIEDEKVKIDENLMATNKAIIELTKEIGE